MLQLAAYTALSNGRAVRDTLIGRALLGTFALAVSAVILIALHDQFWYAPDDGAYADMAERLLHGQVLGRDIQDIHAGYGNFVNAAAFRLFGLDLLSLRYPLVAMGVLQAALMLWLFRAHDMWTATAAAIALTALSTVHFLNPSPHWYCLFLTIVTVAVLANVEREARGRLQIIGALIATVFLFRQLSGVLLAIAVVSYLLLEAPRDRRGRFGILAPFILLLMFAGLAFYVVAMTPITSLLYGLAPLAIVGYMLCRTRVADRDVFAIVVKLAAGAAVGAAPMLIYHLLNGSFMGWLDDSLFAAASLTELWFMRNPYHVLMLLQAAINLATVASLGAMINGVFWILVLLLPVVAGVMLTAELVRGNRWSPLPHPLPFVAIFYALVSVHHQIPVYVFFTAGLSAAAVLWLMAGTGPVRSQVTNLAAAGLTAIALFYHAGQPLTRGVGGIVRGDRADAVIATGLERAHLRVAPQEAELYAALVDLIRRESGPDDAILALPTNPELYFLSGRPSAVRYFNSALGLRSDTDTAALLEALADNPPALVFHRPADKYNTVHSERIVEAISRRYERLESRGGFDIYRRRSASGSGSASRDDASSVERPPAD